MGVINCRKCGRIFNHVSGPYICLQCKEDAEVKFQEVKEFIRENKTATIPDISDECEVEVELIHQWIREERLEFAEDSPVKISCETCGTSIRSGRFCEKCKGDVAHSMGSSIRKPEQSAPLKKDDGKQSPKMHFLR